MQFPFRAVSRAQADLFRDPGRCSKGPTHSILAVLLQECAGAGSSEMGAEVLLGVVGSLWLWEGDGGRVGEGVVLS